MVATFLNGTVLNIKRDRSFFTMNASFFVGCDRYLLFVVNKPVNKLEIRASLTVVTAKPQRGYGGVITP
jgi:hypothetical protein